MQKPVSPARSGFVGWLTWLRFVCFRFFGCRAVALLLLVIATPGVADLLDELTAHVAAVECCDDGGCDEQRGGCCPRTCTHCGCCAHPRALLGTFATVSLSAPESVELGVPRTRRHLPSGYRAPPFRPPVA